MKHYGDITALRGTAVEPVNVVIGGSPCQDLSLAGKRKGLAGKRSGLFMEQIRIIKEMRAADERKGISPRPRFMVWENVPGAFSSNRGADFGAVLQETIRIVCPEAPAIPVPKNGWPTAGCLMGGGWSLAWRVLDAQFWGVPQRRRRIALVADFGGRTAPEVLFERKSLSRDTEPGRAAQKDAPAAAGGGAVRDDRVLAGSAGFNGWKSVSGSIQYQEQLCPTIEANMPPNVVTDTPAYCIQGNVVDRPDTARCNGRGWTEDASYTLNTVDRPAVAYGVHLLDDQGGAVMRADENAAVSPTLRAENHNHLPIIYDARGNGDGSTVCTITGDHENRVTDYTALCLTPWDHQASRIYPEDGQFPALQARERAGQNSQAVFRNLSFGEYCASDTTRTLKAAHDINDGDLVQSAGTVRRLTPLECERLQGFPDGWTDIGSWTDQKGHVHPDASDSARYKALGNSIAIPPWQWVLQRLSLCCGADHTMASLFDGIGGFPYIWERLHGKGSCLWASEIEDFPIAVTKYHFGEEETPC